MAPHPAPPTDQGWSFFLAIAVYPAHEFRDFWTNDVHGQEPGRLGVFFIYSPDSFPLFCLKKGNVNTAPNGALAKLSTGSNVDDAILIGTAIQFFNFYLFKIIQDTYLLYPKLLLNAKFVCLLSYLGGDYKNSDMMAIAD